ncbi:ATP-dependent nuclease [Nocardia pneumoniae]|uniref:ATP-dependent nuclease n=1 Tax=Nocardia pneumoniae TaxID=228601 RepID=UPI0002E71770|nr:hypothetical protein [Nocardia pneumoniae]
MADSAGDKRTRNWRAISHLPAVLQVRRVKVLESNILAPQEIVFDRINAIVGAHGSGKTLLLRMLEAAFGDSIHYGYTPPLFNSAHRIDNEISGVLEVTIVLHGEEHTRRVDLLSNAAARMAIWKDLIGSRSSPRVSAVPTLLSEISYILQDLRSDFKDGLHDSVEYKYKKAEIAAVKSILGKEYSNVTVYGIPDGAEEPYKSWLSPYFIACEKTNIDSSQMSLGELWVHYLIGWDRLQVSAFNLEDMAEPRLIDEPETFLAMRGHRPLVDELVRSSLDLENQLIIATHSPKVLSRFPLEYVRMCIPGPNGILVVRPTSYTQVHDTLGVDFFVKATILVEDEFAAAVLQSICGELDPFLPREIDIVPAGGESEVVAGVRILERSKSMSCIGVLDGDLRNDHKKKRGRASSIYHLPGSMSPEQELTSTATMMAYSVAESLGRTVADVYTALSACSSLDHQYWISKLASMLGRSEQQVIQVLVKLWLENPRVAEQAKELLAVIRELLE